MLWTHRNRAVKGICHRFQPNLLRHSLFSRPCFASARAAKPSTREPSAPRIWQIILYWISSGTMRPAFGSKRGAGKQFPCAVQWAHTPGVCRTGRTTDDENYGFRHYRILWLSDSVNYCFLWLFFIKIWKWNEAGWVTFTFSDTVTYIFFFRILWLIGFCYCLVLVSWWSQNQIRPLLRI